MRRALVVALTCLVALACDEASVREGTRQIATLQEGAMRVLVTPDGIATIYEVSQPDGFMLVSPASEVAALDGVSIDIGPLEQTLTVRQRTTEPTTGAVEVSTEFRSPQIFVPVRIRNGFDVRICRYRVSATLIRATGLVSFLETEDGAQFDVTDIPVIDIENATVAALSDCPVPDKLATPEELANEIVDYVNQALATSAVDALRTSPLEILGLPQRSLQIGRQSPFENRRGTLIVEAETPGRDDAVALTSDGLAAVLDAASDARRAPCAPPLTMDEAVDGATMPLDPAVVRRFGADFALAISTSWLQRTAQAATLAGFSCRGLEDLRPLEQNATLFPVDEVLLAELGLDRVPLGSAVSLGIKPGTLPRLTADAGSGTLQVEADALQLEVYGEVFGAWTRIASVVADVTVALRPQTPSLDRAAFTLEAVDVRNPTLQSEFLAQAPTAAKIERWTQRTLLLALKDRLNLPLPLESASSLRVVNAQVRTRDIVLFLRFEG